MKSERKDYEVTIWLLAILAAAAALLAVLKLGR